MVRQLEQHRDQSRRRPPPAGHLHRGRASIAPGVADNLRKVALLTREYPPEVYGGAGTHVEYLVRELRRLVAVAVYCWGSPREEPDVHAFKAWDQLAEPKPEAAALQAMSIDLAMAAAAKGADLAHSHTWYATLGGHIAKLMWSIPHVMTIHSLEPLRPWKAEQLGGGYALSLFCERTGIEAADAVIAVSQGVRRDVLDCYPKSTQGVFTSSTTASTPRSTAGGPRLKPSPATASTRAGLTPSSTDASPDRRGCRTSSTRC